MVTTAFGAIDILFKTLVNSRKTVDQVNKACADKMLPPAFPIDHSGNPKIPGNRDYRFEGFGVAVFPPKLSFWVHYKSGSANHVALGKFAVSIGIGKLLNLKRLLGQ